MKHFCHRALVAAVTLSLVGCASKSSEPTKAAFPPSAISSKAAQQLITPDQAVDRLLAGNARFVAGKSLDRDLPGQVAATAAAQYPFAVVLGCIDSRTAPELIFDTNLGDIFTPRIAGNYANADILGSMEFATKVVGAKAILVVGHNECGAIMGAVDSVRLGNLTTVVQAVEPAADAVTGAGERSSKNKKFVQATAEANVRRTVAQIRQNSEILRTLEAEGKIRIVGAMQDMNTGIVTPLN